LRNRNLRLAFASLALVSAASVAAPQEQILAVRVANETYELSVPVSRLVMTIPRGNLATDDAPHSGAAASPRYFHLVDPNRGIVISGWFEPAQSYKGFDSFWKGETDAWAKGHLPTPRNLSALKVDNWELAIYDLDVPNGTNTHIRAEWVQLGTWIDVHISVTTAERLEAARNTALDLLKSIRVTPAP
jgi:hypothetical protein